MTQRFGPLAQLESIDRKIGTLARKRDRIETNLDGWRNETDDEMTQRLRENRKRQGHREARFLLTGERSRAEAESSRNGKRAPYRIFLWLVNKCRGTGFSGSEASIGEIVEATGFSRSHVLRALKDLDEIHNLIVRVSNPGQPTRYALSLPESDTYRETLATLFEIRAARLRAAIQSETAPPATAA